MRASDPNRPTPGAFPSSPPTPQRTAGEGSEVRGGFKGSEVVYFEGLPPLIQAQLTRIARLAVGMSADEKECARIFLVGVALEAARNGVDDVVATAETITALAQIVRLSDEASGSEASALVGT